MRKVQINPRLLHFFLYFDIDTMLDCSILCLVHTHTYGGPFLIPGTRYQVILLFCEIFTRGRGSSSIIQAVPGMQYRLNHTTDAIQKSLVRLCDNLAVSARRAPAFKGLDEK